MGNLFMGFPVPRAKIAEMIEGTAPPTIHVINHLPDGSDPIVLPGDIETGQLLKWDGTKFIGVAEPGGGIATRFADPNIYLCTNFEALDTFDATVSGTGTVTLDNAFLKLDTGDTQNSYAFIRKLHDIQYPVGTWNKARAFRAIVALTSLTDNKGTFYISTGSTFTSRHMAFLVEDGVLQGSVGNGSSETKVELADWGAGPYAYVSKYEARFTPGSKAEFYIDGYKQGEITTGLPTGSVDAERWITLYAKNFANSKVNRLTCSQFEFTQAL
jgi:hypothetical protein